MALHMRSHTTPALSCTEQRVRLNMANVERRDLGMIATARGVLPTRSDPSMSQTSAQMLTPALTLVSFLVLRKPPRLIASARPCSSRRNVRLNPNPDPNPNLLQVS